MNNILLDILYLIFCILHDEIPDKERIEKTDFDILLKIAKSHSITGIITYALESAGEKNEAFQKEKSLAIRNTMLLDAERKEICKFFEENKIWYMPLKGVYMKEYYPKIGMRQMCDNDILIDDSRIDEIHKFMLERGFNFHSEFTQNDYGYLKSPCYNFEMHRILFGSYHEQVMYDYYKNIKEKLIRKSDDSFEYKFTDEDFYIYMIAHEYKHFSDSGTGLRSLIDTYVYLNKFYDSMNWEYIHEECKKLGFAEFEEKSRKLALKLFSSAELPELNEDERKMLEFYFGSGTYGISSNKVLNKIENLKTETGGATKFKYILHRIFPPMSVYKIGFPFFYKHKILLPVGWVYRLIRGIFCKNKMIKDEIKTLKNMKNAHE